MIEKVIKSLATVTGAIILTIFQVVVINYISAEPLNLDLYDYLIVYLLNDIGLMIGSDSE